MEIEIIDKANKLLKKIESIEKSISKIQNGIECFVIKNYGTFYIGDETKSTIEKILIAKLNTELYKTKLELKEL